MGGEIGIMCVALHAMCNRTQNKRIPKHVHLNKCMATLLRKVVRQWGCAYSANFVPSEHLATVLEFCSTHYKRSESSQRSPNQRWKCPSTS